MMSKGSEKGRLCKGIFSQLTLLKDRNYVALLREPYLCHGHPCKTLHRSSYDFFYTYKFYYK